ncbi:MAG TPA: sigma-70 family RNA polymerase sigma factor [Myxococcota bacterium]|nr:sigma-70 family RNA polymerase sigma factor [Myxococcota bacterium]
MIRFGRATREFEAAVRAHSSDLFRYAYWLCRDRARAEDIVQEAFARAWKAWADLEDRAAVKAWLFSIVRNEHYRAFERKGLDLDDRDVEELDLPVDHRMDEALDVRRALAALPLSLREPLLLQVLGGLRCAEIAAALETTEGAVMTRLTRARQTMRRLIEAPGALDGVAR